MTLDNRLSKLERRWPERPPEDAADLNLPPAGDYMGWDKWLATSIPRFVERLLCGAGWQIGSRTEETIPDQDGPLGGDPQLAAAWHGYRRLTWRIDCDIFDLWYPNRHEELFAAKLEFNRLLKRKLAEQPHDSLAGMVLFVLPRDDGEADRWAPMHPPTSFGGYNEASEIFAEALRNQMADPRRVDYRRRWLQRLAAEGDDEAREDLAELEAEVARRDAEAAVKAAAEGRLEQVQAPAD
jgi:hypothetical protein